MTQELYALGMNRSVQLVVRFLDHFLPSRKGVGDGEYPIPELSSKPSLVIKSEKALLEYLEAHPQEFYGLYWNDAVNPSSMQAMVFYTLDGKVIFGLAVDERAVADFATSLADFVGAEFAALGFEQRPPDTAEEFRALYGPKKSAES